ncbi:hypothetical protein ACWDR3_00345 [Streptomyces sp. NPDC001002]
MWRRGTGVGAGELSATEFRWTDEDAVAANADGRVTAAQYALIEELRIPGVGMPAGIPRQRGRRRRTAALTACRTAGAVGEVVALPDGTREARIGAGRLAVPEGAPELPPPGTYRLYWLESAEADPDPGVLLSARPLDRHEAEAAPDFSATGAGAAGSRPLLEAMGLTQWDLAANRAGRLTPRQRRPLLREFCLRAVGWGLNAAVVLGFFLWINVTRIVDLVDSGPDGSWFPDITVLLIVFGVSAYLGTMLMMLMWLLVRESRTGALWQVLRTPAPVRCAVDAVTVHGAGTRWQLSAAAMTFEVTESVARAFAEPGRYELHHLPDPRMLLSAERADGDPSATLT